MIVKRNIILIGSMGSGKSHFGRNLADLKGWQFVDTDRVLEGRFGLPIAEIFKKIGEKAFRRAELDVLKKVSLYHEAVISVGGNFPIEQRTLRSLKKFSFIIGIRAAQYRIVSRVNRRVGKRPTMDYTNVSAFVHNMIQSWKPVYKQCDYVLDTTNGRTYDFMKAIEQQFEALEVQFKTRRQPKSTETVDQHKLVRTEKDNERQSVKQIKLVKQTRLSKETKSSTQRTTVSKEMRAGTKQQKGRRHEKNSTTNKRWRRTRNERSHSGHHKKSNT
ncbi:shikimate kinase [Veillonella tobetsuensis]|jgi:shikimate kinase|uniref:Shikimate kinase n=1 Tax=Veillonella tobetsuensis TaxID=1110546 RepID=A0A480B739_9FIRM|nr:shikimate kinase [Veillonella tobetsuensis]GCL67675.1 hypothetical protein PAGU1578_12960 [Veillonella tobetsuensis]